MKRFNALKPSKLGVRFHGNEKGDFLFQKR